MPFNYKPPNQLPLEKTYTKLTPELQDQCCQLLKLGNHVKTVCRIVGIHYETWRDWIKKGEQGQQPYADFYYAVNRADAEGEAWHVKIMHDAGEVDWRASKSFLQMRNPEVWNRQTVDVHHVLEKIDDERLFEESKSGENELIDMEKRIVEAIKELVGGVVDDDVIDVEGEN